MTKLWFIVTVRSGSETVLHEVFTRSGFEVYTPFEKKFLRPASRKARFENQPPVEYADPLFRGFLFVASSAGYGEALMGIEHMKRKRRDVYGVMFIQDKPVSFTERNFALWQERLHEAHASSRTIITRGYNPKRDSRKNLSRQYAGSYVQIPEFTRGEVVQFLEGGFQSLKAEVTGVIDSRISVLIEIFGCKREIHGVDVFDVRKAS